MIVMLSFSCIDDDLLIDNKEQPIVWINMLQIKTLLALFMVDNLNVPVWQYAKQMFSVFLNLCWHLWH